MTRASHLAHDLPLVIGGQEVSSPELLLIRFPYTGEVIGAVPALPAAEVWSILDAAAQRRFDLTRHERATVLNRIADRLEAEAEELAHLITLESGLCLKDTRHEVRRAQDVFRFAALEALRDDGETFACDISPNGRNRRAHTLREPLRLITAITPFNHPLNQVAHKVAPAIATNNVMVVKPSSRTPLSAVRLAWIMREAGLPDGMVTIVTGKTEEIGDLLWTHPAVELVSFTGGTEVGKRIAQQAGYRRLVLELGGNDPLIILSDADLNEAVRLAVAGSFKNSGQRCTAVKRLIVERSLADAFASRLAEEASKLATGDPRDPNTDIGTVICEEAAIEIERRIGAAVSAGATLLTGGERRGAQITPAVLDHVTPQMELVAKETFGPCAPILRAQGLDDAINLANAQEYGLSAGVVSNDWPSIVRCIRELRCGTVNIREIPGFRTELTPFGGTKDSGLGVKEGIREAMRAMTFVKLFTLPWE
jgi:aldehyde dehydrogenase (NAD+)